LNLNLTEDDKDDLKELVESESFKILLKKVIPQLVRGQLDYLATSPDEALLRERDILNGMKKLQKHLNELKF
jgi:hypothetical protein